MLTDAPQLGVPDLSPNAEPYQTILQVAAQLEGLPHRFARAEAHLDARERVMASFRFRSGAVPILLATNAAARGLEVREVGQVINYELPESAEWLTHRVGRTGRMGRAGRAVTFLTAEDAPKWRQFEKVLGRRLERRPWAHPGAARVSAPAAATTGLESQSERQARPPRADGSARSQRGTARSVRGQGQKWWRPEQRRRGTTGTRSAA